MARQLTAGIIPALLVLLFAYTGAGKVFAFDAFKGTLYNQPFPHALATPLIFLTPAAEILTAALLLFNKTRLLGLYSALILLTLFTAYTAAILLKLFNKTPCSCGGIFRHLSWQQHFWINIALTGTAAFAIVRNRIERKPIEKNQKPS